jgi:hypothetical protein
MPNNDHQIRPGDASGNSLRRRLARLRAALQDELARDDEKWAADRGYRCWRAGWTTRVRDPRFDLRQECTSCAGSGRRRTTGDRCPECVDGVITLDPFDDGDRR